MTDKQIACAWLSHRLNGMIPDHDDLRSIAEVELTEERCYRICERILAMADKMRAPLLEYLNRSGVDATRDAR